MGLFSLTQELAIDLGTANTLIIHNGKVVVDEPSIVALDVHTGKLVAIGTQARQMHEKTNPNIKTIRPLKDGVIADFNATELMLRGMIKKVKTSGNRSPQGSTPRSGRPATNCRADNASASALPEPSTNRPTFYSSTRRPRRSTAGRRKESTVRSPNCHSTTEI